MIHFQWNQETFSKQDEINLIKSIKKYDCFQGKLKMIYKSTEEVNHALQLMNGNIVTLQLKGHIEVFSPNGKRIGHLTLKRYILDGIEWKENYLVCTTHDLHFINLNSMKEEKTVRGISEVINSIVPLPNSEFACGTQNSTFFIIDINEKVSFQKKYDSQVTRMIINDQGDLIIPTSHGIIYIMDINTKTIIKEINISEYCSKNLWDFIQLKGGDYLFATNEKIFKYKDQDNLIHNFEAHSTDSSTIVQLKDKRILLRTSNYMYLFDTDLKLLENIPIPKLKSWKLKLLKNGNVLSINYSENIEIFE